MTQDCDPDEATLSEDELKLLVRLDERTERIDQRVERVIDQADENSGAIEKNRHRIKRNTTVLGGYSAALASLAVWIAEKVTHIF